LCVELCSSRSARYKNVQISRILITRFLFLYTSHMAACYDNDVNDVTATHVYLTTPLST